MFSAIMGFLPYPDHTNDGHRYHSDMLQGERIHRSVTAERSHGALLTHGRSVDTTGSNRRIKFSRSWRWNEETRPRRRIDGAASANGSETASSSLAESVGFGDVAAAGGSRILPHSEERDGSGRRLGIFGQRLGAGVFRQQPPFQGVAGLSSTRTIDRIFYRGEGYQFGQRRIGSVDQPGPVLPIGTTTDAKDQYSYGSRLVRHWSLRGHA